MAPQEVARLTRTGALPATDGLRPDATLGTLMLGFPYV